MTDWRPLATGDPLAGDPDGTLHLARRFDDLVGELTTQAAHVVDVAPDGLWTGLAAQRFAAARDRLPVQLRGVARRCAMAADALARWGRDLDAAQAAGRRLVEQARVAERDVAEARRGIAAIRAAGDVWVGPDWHAHLAEAQDRLARARWAFDGVVADVRGAGRRTADALAEADTVLDDPAWAVGPLARMLAGMVVTPTDAEFVVTDAGLVLNTPESWRWETYHQAGIDAGAWRPDRGLDALDGIVVRAWEFYADLYQRRPDEFAWAGMATLAGGTFYAAFQDVHVLRRALESGAVTADEVGDLFRRVHPGLPGPVVDQLGDLAARDMDLLAREVRWVETRFLDMQRQIFDDLAWQHVAYEQGGLDAMEALRASGHLRAVHVDAWRDIASGDYHRVLEGNRDLLRHEQSRIIGDDYDLVRDRGPVTWAMTMGMSAVAHSPVPGGHPFRDVVPYELAVDTPDRVPLVPDGLVPDRIPFTDVPVPGGGGLYVDTPDSVTIAELPLNNVSIFDHRWRWIESDMLPAWVDHLDAGTAADLVAEPIASQAARQRLVPDVGIFRYEPDR